MIFWSDHPRHDREIAEAARLYGEMWSVERIAEIFGFNYDAMRRLLARHASLS
jgi:hypothetical protein